MDEFIRPETNSNPPVGNTGGYGSSSFGPAADSATPSPAAFTPTVSTPPVEPLLRQAPPSPIKQKHDHKKLLHITAFICIVIGIAMVTWFLGYANGKTEGRNQTLSEIQARETKTENSDTNTSATDPTANVVPGTATKLVLGNLKDPEYKNEIVSGAIGTQVEVSDGFVLLVTGIERNFQTTDKNYKLTDGKELVKVNFIMGNITKGKSKDLTSFSFRLEDSKGAQLTPETIASFENKFDTVKINSGMQAKGSIVYAVDRSEKPLRFTRSQVYRITNQNKEVTTKISILVAAAK